jgi:hypothetical protein
VPRNICVLHVNKFSLETVLTFTTDISSLVAANPEVPGSIPGATRFFFF